MYDPKTQTFHTQQIGSFYAFERLDDEFGVSLIGEARIAKRNQKVCSALAELFAEGKLNFSWEILAGEYTERDGVTIIDASEKNSLIGMAVVTVPAYPEAKALELVAELDNMKAMEQIFKHTEVRDAQNIFAQVALETIRAWAFEAMLYVFPDNWYDCEIERICSDCLIVYNVMSAQTFKIDLTISDDGFAVTDVYEVAYMRKENNMENIENQVIEEAVEEIAEVTEVAEQEAPAEEVTEEQEVEVSEVTEEAETEETTEEVAEEVIESEVNPLQAELDKALDRIRELEEANAARELEEDRKALKAFAQRVHMDMEDKEVKAALEEGDYKKMVKLSETMSKINPFVSEMTTTKGYTLLEKE